MGSSNNVIIRDRKNNLWEFHLEDNKDLRYSIALESKDFGEMKTIDSGIMEFSADIDENGTIHLVSMGEKGELKHCKWSEEKWIQKNIHNIKESGYEASALELVVIEGIINILCILRRRRNEDIGIICNIRWDGIKHAVQGITNIRLHPILRASYKLEDLGNKNISLIFANNANGFVFFNRCAFQGNSFGPPTQILELRGNSIDFATIRHNDALNIINVSKHDSLYVLNHIQLKNDSRERFVTNLFQSSSEIYDPLFVRDGGDMWAFWTVGDRLLYSSYGTSWSKAEAIKTDKEKEIKKYCYISADKSDDKMRQHIFGTALPGLALLLPAHIPAHGKKSLERGPKKYSDPLSGKQGVPLRQPGDGRSLGRKPEKG